MLKIITPAEQHSLKILYLTDNTGIFDPTTRPEAWGISGAAETIPNISDVVDINDTVGIVIVLEQAGIFYTYNKSTVDIKNLGFPNTNNQRIALEASGFGLEYFSDGKATLTIRVSGTHIFNDGNNPIIEEGFVSEYTEILYFTKGVECCRDKAARDIAWNPSINFCDDKGVKHFNKVQTHFDVLQAFISDKNYIDADFALAELKTLCINSNCGGC
jgi:hypothetical protein